MRAAGEAAFHWDIDADRLTWSGNVGEVLAGMPAKALTRNSTFCKLTGNAPSRCEVISNERRNDQGNGVPYQYCYSLKLQGAEGPEVWIEESGRWFAGPTGKPATALGVVRVITERHAREERLRKLVEIDPLTGEYNRSQLVQLVGKALGDAERFRSSFAFLLVSIDNLGRINEAFGFDVADEVIATAARRIRSCLRGGDVIGRFSGNKFGIILRECTLEQMEIAAQRFLAAIRNDVIDTSSGPVAITASIGGVIAPRHARTVDEAVRRAQEALQSSRQRRNGHFTSWRPNVARESQRRRNIEITGEIVRAINERRIAIAFEPVIDAVRRTPVFYECLLRVSDAHGEPIPSMEAIPIAEKLGLIRLVDHHILTLVIQELAAAPKLRLSLNLSPETTADPDWWSSLDGLLRCHAGVAERLIVEITETTAIQDVEDVRGFVTRLKNLGARIAIDDFGAGFTSFRNLRRLGVDMVKIDGAFVQNLRHSADDRSFVQSMIDLARRLGLQTVAEWVQDEISAALLRDWGCTFLQGHFAGLASTDRPWQRTSTRSTRPSRAPAP